MTASPDVNALAPAGRKNGAHDSASPQIQSSCGPFVTRSANRTGSGTAYLTATTRGTAPTSARRSSGADGRVADVRDDRQTGGRLRDLGVIAAPPLGRPEGSGRLVDHHPERTGSRRLRGHPPCRGQIAADADEQRRLPRERRRGDVDEPPDLVGRQGAELAGVARDRDGTQAAIDRPAEDAFEAVKVQAAVLEERRGKDGDDGVQGRRVEGRHHRNISHIRSPVRAVTGGGCPPPGAGRRPSPSAHAPSRRWPRCRSGSTTPHRRGSPGGGTGRRQPPG